MFQLDRGDLDFGIYRVMNLKSREIEEFLDHSLLPQVRTALGGISDDERNRLEDELAEKIQAAQALGGIDPEDTDAVKELRALLADASADESAEADVYNHLANFFSRYYDGGDFMSLRRYSGGGQSSYLIPYDGEEVKLHWANADQYYIKTTENYASYAFSVTLGAERRRVRFEVASADNEKDSIKETAGKQRRFVLTSGDGAVSLRGADLVIRFEHRPLTPSEKKEHPGSGARQQDRLNEDAERRLLGILDPAWRDGAAVLAATPGRPDRTLLGKHIAAYTAKNSFDYFIHKDLGAFLRRELDLYVKSAVLDLEDLERGDRRRLERALARTRAVRRIAHKIIDFLAQIEDFQKRLWLKKKLVLDTQYCVTLDRVPNGLYADVAANRAQREEWVSLFAIDEIDADLANGGAGYSDPLTVPFLEANPYLVLDTRHFDRGFKERLVAAVSDAGPLEDQQDGLLIHGENFQALSLLTTRYRGEMDCIYIDPPYNTGDSTILYKNGYLRSSWLALMADRLACATRLLSSDPVLFIAIDDFEMANLSKLADSLHPLRREMIIVNHHPQGGKAKTLAQTHEYMLVCVGATSDRTLVGRAKASNVEERPFRRSGTAESNFRRGRPNSFYALLIDPRTKRVVGKERPPDGPAYPTGTTEEGHLRVYPLGKDGEERVWRRSFESCEELIRSGSLICTENHTIYHSIDAGARRTALFSNWYDSRYNAGTHGANLLADIMGEKNSFPYPKSVYTVQDAVYSACPGASARVLDFFAGSGTSGHAVIDLERAEPCGRKYILVEMGQHFDTVLLPRLKKVVYSRDWKDGRPVSRVGTSQIIKYCRLESYEDSLDGLEVQRADGDLLRQDPGLMEDYCLRYALDAETATSPTLLGRALAAPYAYTISVLRDGGREEVSVDLPESFNWLLGLRVVAQRVIDGVLAVNGEDRTGRGCLVLWRDVNRTDNASLDDWFERHRGSLTRGVERLYVNGDHTLNALRGPDDGWTAETIEPAMRRLMFGDVG